MPKNNNALTGIRFIAAFMVLITHVVFQTTKNHTNYTARFFNRFDFAVAIFFSLSAYLLWKSYFINKTPNYVLNKKQFLKIYFIKRFYRIYPTYFVLLLFVFLYLPNHYLDSHKNILANFLLIQNIIPFSLLPDLTQMWSLAVEMQFYLLLPFLLVFKIKFPKKFLSYTFILIAICTVFTASIPLFFKNIGSNPQIWVSSFFPWFFVGIYLAELDDKKKNFNKYIKNPAISLIIALIFFLLGTTNLSGPANLEETGTIQFLLKILFGSFFSFFIIYPLIFLSKKYFFYKFLNSKLLIVLGSWSYGIFIWHLVILNISLEILNIGIFQGKTLTVLIITTLISIIVAGINFFIVENFFSSFSNKRTNTINNNT